MRSGGGRSARAASLTSRTKASNLTGGGDPPLVSSLDEDLAVQHDERLRGTEVPVPRGRMATLAGGLEQCEFAAALLAGHEEPFR